LEHNEVAVPGRDICSDLAAPAVVVGQALLLDMATFVRNGERSGNCSTVLHPLPCRAADDPSVGAFTRATNDWLFSTHDVESKHPSA
jgi:hypothetical protein